MIVISGQISGWQICQFCVVGYYNRKSPVFCLTQFKIAFHLWSAVFSVHNFYAGRRVTICDINQQFYDPFSNIETTHHIKWQLE